jgi:hypothetical protein
MKVLFVHIVSRPVAKYLPRHDVQTALRLGWLNSKVVQILVQQRCPVSMSW